MTDRLQVTTAIEPGHYAATLARIAARHGTSELAAGPVVSMLLPVQNSLIVRKNKCVAHCFTIAGVAGLFRKGSPDTRALGRHFCDMTKTSLSCQGFFTTDEIPMYGLGVDDKAYINYHAGADADRDVTVLTLYTRALATQVRKLLVTELGALFDILRMQERVAPGESGA